MSENLVVMVLGYNKIKRIEVIKKNIFLRSWKDVLVYIYWIYIVFKEDLGWVLSIYIGWVINLFLGNILFSFGLFRYLDSYV